MVETISLEDKEITGTMEELDEADSLELIETNDGDDDDVVTEDELFALVQYKHWMVE